MKLTYLGTSPDAEPHSSSRWFGIASSIGEAVAVSSFWKMGRVRCVSGEWEGDVMCKSREQESTVRLALEC